MRDLAYSARLAARTNEPRLHVLSVSLSLSLSTAREIIRAKSRAHFMLGGKTKAFHARLQKGGMCWRRACECVNIRTRHT